MLKRCLTVLHYLRRKCKKYLYYCISCKYFLSFSTAGVGDDRFENVILKTVYFLCICAPLLESEYSFGLDVVQWLHSLCIVGEKKSSQICFSTLLICLGFLQSFYDVISWIIFSTCVFHIVYAFSSLSYLSRAVSSQ